MSIGKNIAKYRKLSGLTQEELGKQLGVTNQAVSKWESEVSMPDIMLLPEIASALCINLDDIYGISEKRENISVSADDFPSLCHEKLRELFYSSTRVRFTNVDNSDEAQLEYQKQKLNDGCRIGCFSNSNGAFILTGDFAFIDLSYRDPGSEKIIRPRDCSDYTLMYLTDNNLRKVLFYEYEAAIRRSKEENAEFSFEEIMNECYLTEIETSTALKLLCDTRINETYTDHSTKETKYVLRLSGAAYALAIYKLAGLLSEEDPVWIALRDTGTISDYVF